MKRKITIFLLFVVVLAGFYAFWQRHKKRFIVKQPFSVVMADSGNVFVTATSAKTVSDFLKEKNIALSEKDYVFPAPDAKIFPGSKIIIRRAMPVAIEVDGKTLHADTLGTSVRDAIAEANITLSPVDKVAPETTSLLSTNLDIKITRINFEEVKVDEDIPFSTIEKEDNTVMWRQKAVKQQGEKGTKEKTYKVTFTNGKETNRVLLSSQITKQPTPEIDVVGTKIVVGKTQSGAATWYVNGDDLTAASLEFAHGKYLRVTNRANGKSVIVQVNDSGPYGKGRVIDLNKKAFAKIADIGAGVINVKVEEILN